jgi:hypothetical protein
MKIVIAAPYYNPAKGGHIVVHKLCDVLVRQGMDAWLMFTNVKRQRVNPAYKTPVTTAFNPETDVAIYHNSIKGNPWKAKYIIRWMLYTPTNETDGVCLYYSKQFGDGQVMRLIEPNLDIFVDKGLPRKGTCWVWRKAERQGWTVADKPISGYEISRDYTNEELVDIFNKHERFISYDGASFLTAQAVLCGCDSIIPKPLNGLYAHPHGVSFSMDECAILKARSEHGLFRAALTDEYKKQDVLAVDIITDAIKKLGVQ